MDNKWIWIGLGAVVLLLLLSKRGSSSTVLPSPDTSGETAARYSFAESGLSALADAFSTSVTSDAQVRAEQSRDNAYLESARIFGDTERFKASSGERTAMAQFDAMLAAGRSRDQSQVDVAKAEHKYDWVSGIASAIGSLF